MPNGNPNMDNFKIDITCKGQELLAMALELAFASAPRRQATHYSKDDDYGMCFYWGLDEGAKSIPLPVVLTPALATEIVWQWLNEEAKYPPEPDHDGSNSKGWTVYNERWGHVHGSFYGIVGIRPAWALHGK